MKLFYDLRKGVLLLLITILVSCSTQTKSDDPTAKLAERVLKERAKEFIFETMDSESGKDVFELDKQGKKVVIRGNNGVSKAAGLNYYLENYCNAQVSIHYNQLNLPDKLPLPEKTKVETPFDYRYFFNYCTFGYTMPWWDWERWEEIIDYMALKGVNMPLAIVGQEGVWKEVFTDMGLSEQDIDDFFVGPAHLPWGWMGNIDGVAGPLPDSWIEQRVELQKKILERARELGMKPVLPAFTGHVPEVFKEKFPDSKIMKLDPWAGIPGTYFLDSGDSLFTQIGSKFIEKQTEMFGTDHLYSADCFIEVDPPSSDPEFLKETGAAVYNSMAKVDPEAKWVIQGWFFFFRQEFWQKEQGEAFFAGVPKGSAIVLDLYGEKNPTWDKTDAFFGQDWIWNVICNEDQKVNMSGDLKAMQEQLSRAYNSEGDKGLKGIGVIPEGIGYNMVVQDFIFGKAWNPIETDINEWLEKYAMRRYGTQNKDAIKAWSSMLNNVYGRTRTMWSPLITTPQLIRFSGEKEDIRHVRVGFEITEEDPFAWDVDVYDFAKSFNYMLAASSELKDSPAYQFDLTNMSRELLYCLTHKYIDELSTAFYNKDTKALEVAKKQMLKLFDDMDDITGCNEHFMAGKWLNDAMKWGETQEEKDYYNTNARTIVTIWQPWEHGYLRDYAGRDWNGMMREYYKPRWELFISMLEKSLSENKEFDRKAFDKAVRKIDYQWTLKNNSYPDKPVGNIVEVAKRVWTDYEEVFTKK